MSAGSNLPVPEQASPARQDDVLFRPGARALGGTFWSTAGHFVPFAYTLAISVVAARVLGPDDMGRQSYIAFIVLVASTLTSGGLPPALARYVGETLGRRREGAIPELLAWLWRLELVAGLLGASVLVALALTGQTPRLAWILGAVSVLAGVLHKVPGSFLIGSQHWRENSIVILATGAGGTVATIVVLLLGGGITGMFAVAAAATVAMLVWAKVLERRVLGRIVRERAPLGDLRRRFLRYALGLTPPMLLSFVVYQRSEFFFLDHYSSDAQIAVYSIAFSAAAAFLALPTSTANVVAPSVAALYGAGDFERIRSGYGRALRLMLFVVVPLTAGVVALGPELLRLVYGSEYAETGDVLLVLVAVLPFVPLGSVSSAVITGYGRIRFPLLVTVVGVVTDLTLAAVLVPRLDALGAAIANVSAQIAGAALALTYAVRLVSGVRVGPSHLLRNLLAAAIAGGCARFLLEVGSGGAVFVLALACGVGVYAALAAALRTLAREDASWLVDAVGGRAARVVAPVARRLAGKPLGLSR